MPNQFSNLSKRKEYPVQFDRILRVKGYNFQIKYMSMYVEKRTEPVEMQYSASSHLNLLYLTTILEESQKKC